MNRTRFHKSSASQDPRSIPLLNHPHKTTIIHKNQDSARRAPKQKLRNYPRRAGGGERKYLKSDKKLKVGVLLVSRAAKKEVKLANILNSGVGGVQYSGEQSRRKPNGSSKQTRCGYALGLASAGLCLARASRRVKTDVATPTVNLRGSRLRVSTHPLPDPTSATTFIIRSSSLTFFARCAF